MVEKVNEEVELTYLRAGGEPEWERPKRNGRDITDEPELQTPYQRQRRAEFEARVARYRADGLLPAEDSNLDYPIQNRASCH